MVLSNFCFSFFALAERKKRKTIEEVEYHSAEGSDGLDRQLDRL
jgi:hypothetical protein